MNIVNHYEWSTHIPLLKSLTEVMQPKLIVELGTGLHSTPIFLQSTAEKLYFIDNDQAWLSRIQESNTFDNRCTVRYHGLGEEITLTTFLRQLTAEKKAEISNYYIALSAEINSIAVSPKMLFVDHYTCARTLSINLLFESFDIIAYHDCQPKGTKWYEYYFNQGLLDNYELHYLKSPTSWTGCFIKKSFNDYSTLNAVMRPYVDSYCDENQLSRDAMSFGK